MEGSGRVRVYVYVCSSEREGNRVLGDIHPGYSDLIVYRVLNIVYCK